MSEEISEKQKNSKKYKKIGRPPGGQNHVTEILL